MKVKSTDLWALLWCVIIVAVLLGYVGLSASHSIHIWDESIYANNSLEMHQQGDPLVYHLNGVPDHHNSKPPLVIWLQALSYFLFGPNEFAVRFPTYLALLATLAAFVIFGKKVLNDTRAGFVAAMVLLGTSGAMRRHVFLSGDLDGMLTFFCCAIFLLRLRQIQRREVTAKDCYQMGFLLLLGYFTKSTAVFFVAPGLLISYLLDKQLIRLLRLPAFWQSLAVFTITVSGYYLIREQYDPGFWAVVWHTEYYRITTNIQPWLVFPYDLYFDQLWNKYMHFWLPILAMALPVHLLLPNQPNRKLVLHGIVMCTIFLLTISMPDAKLQWYDAPVYPMAAMIVGIVISDLLTAAGRLINRPMLSHGIATALLLGICMLQVHKTRMLVRAEMEEHVEPEYATTLLKELIKKYPQTQQFAILEVLEHEKFRHLYDAILFYQKLLPAAGKSLRLVKYIKEVLPGDTLIIRQAALLDTLQQQYDLKLLDSNKNCKWVAIGQK